jgi:ADP-ribose pyrophosphatase
MKLADKWNRISSKTIGSYRIFTIREDRYRLPRNNQEAPFYILESNDWVNVIPMTENGEVLLIRQFRFGIEEVTLEIPGGIVDSGYTPLQADRKNFLKRPGINRVSGNTWALSIPIRPS